MRNFKVVLISISLITKYVKYFLEMLLSYLYFIFKVPR